MGRVLFAGIFLAVSFLVVPGGFAQMRAQAGEELSERLMSREIERRKMMEQSPMMRQRGMPDQSRMMESMMGQMSDMMGRMTELMRNPPAGSAKDMSDVMKDMSKQMTEMSGAIETGAVPEKSMEAMRDRMARMQERVYGMEARKQRSPR